MPVDEQRRQEVLSRARRILMGQNEPPTQTDTAADRLAQERAMRHTIECAKAMSERRKEVHQVAMTDAQAAKARADADWNAWVQRHIEFEREHTQRELELVGGVITEEVSKLTDSITARIVSLEADIARLKRESADNSRTT